MSRSERFSYLLHEFSAESDYKELIFAGNLLRRAALLWPKRTALLYDGEKITFEQLYRKTLPITQALLDRGISGNSKVIILYENSLNFYVAYYAAWQTGAVVAPVNIFLKPHELEHIINDCSPDVILVSRKLQEKIPQELAHLIINEDDLNSLAQSGKQVTGTSIYKSENALAVLLYTSGTTGLPKGVMLSSKNIITNALQGACEFNITAHERIYAALPLFHSYMQNCCLWGAIMMGAATIIVPKIDRSNLLKGLKLLPTIVLGIPQLYGLFCLMKHVSFPEAKFFFCGGDALPDKIRKGFELMFRRKICNGYGLTETSPIISLNLTDHAVATNNIGRPVIGVEICLKDNEGNTLKKHEIGALHVKGDNVMMGYHKAPEATAAVLKDGWLNTGDLATIDRLGNLLICGREKDLIVNKGIKIYPQEIENVLMSHPQVTAVAVIGIPDTNTEIPICFIAVRNNYPELLHELNKICMQRLADYKIPRAFYVEKELPMTSTGKVDKKILRARLMS